MHPLTTRSGSSGLKHRILDRLPLLLVPAALFAVGRWEPASPGVLAIVIPAAVALFAVAFVTAPIVVFWLVPLSMVSAVYMPVWPFELLVLLLAGILLFRNLPAMRLDAIRLGPVEQRYLVFLALLLPGIV